MRTVHIDLMCSIRVIVCTYCRSSWELVALAYACMLVCTQGCLVPKLFSKYTSYRIFEHMHGILNVVEKKLRGCLVPKLFSKYPSYQIFEHMHGILNAVEKKLIIQFN